MLPRGITRRLFVVPVANNDRGKTQIIRSLVRQGERAQVQQVRRGPRLLTSPWGRPIDALIVPRSYQETLAGEFGSVEQALNAIDSTWRERDLVILPSHLVAQDCAVIIDLAHSAGFDAVTVHILLEPAELGQSQECLQLPWDERWTLANNRTPEPEGQVESLGHDLWAWTAGALERR